MSVKSGEFKKTEKWLVHTMVAKQRRCTDLEQLESAVDIVPYSYVLIEAARGEKRLADGGLHAGDLTVVERGYHVFEAKVAAFADNQGVRVFDIAGPSSTSATSCVCVC